MIRNTDVKPRRRPYSSALRDEQTEDTRARILEALIRTMAAGVAGLSMAAVAREAGVSIPTIYRHFGSKRGLLAALNPYVIAKGGLMPEAMPENFDDLEREIRRLFRNLDRMDPTLRAAMASELGQEARREMMPARRAKIRLFVSGLGPALPDSELGRLADVTLILGSTASFRAYKDYLGLGPDASAALVSWAIRTLIRGARRVEDETT
jgi:AcrR family transcriptional regulator